mgnify:CR=1 FL=1
MTTEIEALEQPEPFRHGDGETAAALRSSAAWMRTMFAILPLAVGVRNDDAHNLGHQTAMSANDFAAPYQVPDVNFGWSARDACYSYGSFELAEDEALIRLLLTTHEVAVTIEEGSVGGLGAQRVYVRAGRLGGVDRPGTGPSPA